MWGKKKKVDKKEDNRDHKSSTNKIINNEYYSKEIDTRSITFNVDPYWDNSMDETDVLHLELLMTRIADVVKGSKYQIYVDDHEKKLNKAEINEVYYFVADKLKEFTRTDLFSQISEYFDIDYHKFFNSLSNKFKEELINELQDSSYYKKKKIHKLF